MHQCVGDSKKKSTWGLVALRREYTFISTSPFTIYSTYYNPDQCTVLSMHVFISKVSIDQVLAEDPLCTVYKV